MFSSEGDDVYIRSEQYRRIFRNNLIIDDEKLHSENAIFYIYMHILMIPKEFTTEPHYSAFN
ncbi:hypothetical protein B194_0516 [Serratia plymuthica A30]|nr:hypothetical protein B194_0516 [Serratia plymuthica A30]